jgi:hypothetical protein
MKNWEVIVKNRITYICCSVTLLLAFLPAAAQSSKGDGSEEELRRLNTQEVDGLLRNDLRILKPLWSDDFVVTNPFNKFVDKPQVVNIVADGTLAFKAYDRQIEYMRFYGITAIVAGSETVVWAGKLPISGQTSRLRFTAIWMKQAGRWQEVARHANIIVQK